MHNNQTKIIVHCALFIALGVLLGGALNIPAFMLGTYSMKIGFGTLPVILAGVAYGPLYGGIVGGITDVLQALIFPKGAFVPWFTIIGILFGLIPGLFFNKGQAPTFKRLFMAIFSGQFIGSVVCNTFLMIVLYSMPFEVVVWPRLINQAIMIPLLTVITYYLMPVLQKFGVGRNAKR